MSKSKGKSKSAKALKSALASLPPLIPVNADGALESVAIPIERDRWGRPLLVDAAGKRRGFTRCTTYIDVLEDRSALEKWKVRTALLGASEKPVIVREATNISEARSRGDVDEAAWKARMNALGQEAVDQGGGSVRAQAGTDLHALTEILDRGMAFPEGLIDDDYLDLQAYIFETRRLGLQVAAIELFVVHDGLGVAGTLDRVYVVNGTFTLPDGSGTVTFDNDLLVGDVKTGSIHPGKVAMQVGIYATSQRYVPETGGREPLPVRTDWGLLVHLPQGEATCAVYLVDLTLGMGGVAIAGQVRSWRNAGKRAINERSPL